MHSINKHLNLNFVVIPSIFLKLLLVPTSLSILLPCKSKILREGIITL